MSEVKKSSEIIKEMYDAAAEEKKVHERNKIRLLSLIKNRLKGMVLVPEEKWHRLEKMLFFENVLEGDALIPQARWERIKALIEDFPCLSCKAQGIEPNSGECQEELDGMCLDEILKNHKELKEAIEDCPVLDKCTNHNTDKCTDYSGGMGSKNYVRKNDEVKEIAK